MTTYLTIMILTFTAALEGFDLSAIPVIDHGISELSPWQWDCPDVSGISQSPTISDAGGLSLGIGRSINLFPGWPVSVAGFQNRGGIYCNLDSDTAMEVVYTTGGNVYAWNLDGSLVTGWPQSLNLFAYGAPALGDVDGDGVDEIVVGTRFGGTGNSGWLHVFEKDGSDAVGFPLSLPNGGATRTPALADLDGDGALEIIIEERNWPDGWVCVYNGDGSVRSGWPQPMDHVPASSAAVGDINGDSIPEIIGVSYLSIYAFDADGDLLSGFPHTPAGDRCFSYSSPVLADMNGDGNREIICGDHSTSAGNGQVHVIHNDGSEMTGWPQTTTHWIYAPPAVGDINGDAQPDIVIGDKQLSGSPVNHIYGWDASGTALPGFPIGPVWAVNTQVIIADLDGDQLVELLFDDNTMLGGVGNYHGYNHDGSMMAGWPLETVGTSFFINPFVADLNLDGNLDIVGAGSDDDYVYVHIWDANIPVDQDLDFLTILQYNVQHDGVYEPPGTTGIENGQEISVLQKVNLHCAPSPFSGSTEISVNGAVTGETMTITIRDICGRLVRVVGTETSGTSGMISTGWDGRDSSGGSVPAGIYCVTITAGSRILAVERVTLLR